MPSIFSVTAISPSSAFYAKVGLFHRSFHDRNDVSVLDLVLGLEEEGRAGKYSCRDCDATGAT